MVFFADIKVYDSTELIYQVKGERLDTAIAKVTKFIQYKGSGKILDRIVFNLIRLDTELSDMLLPKNKKNGK